LAERRRELAVRLIVGAAPSDLSVSVLRSGLLLGGIGSALGIGGGLLLGRALRSLLWEVGPVDLLACGIALGVAAALAVLGSLLPALRVMESDPMDALRA
jgi:ABC-type antimicrobial peptide transport system permease subunit